MLLIERQYRYIGEFSMRLMHCAILSALLLAPHVLQAQELKDGTPGVITGGSGNVSVGGLPAARNGDATDSGDVVAGGSKNVFINGKPAVTTGDKSGCGGIVIGGGSNVFINGKPVARAGDTTTGCPGK
jgi:uncharacterized Zn-binding protein involved in type VI secretion